MPFTFEQFCKASDTKVLYKKGLMISTRQKPLIQEAGVTNSKGYNRRIGEGLPSRVRHCHQITSRERFDWLSIRNWLSSYFLVFLTLGRALPEVRVEHSLKESNVHPHDDRE